MNPNFLACLFFILVSAGTLLGEERPLVVYSQPPAEISTPGGRALGRTGTPFRWSTDDQENGKIVFLLTASGRKPLRLEFTPGELSKLKRLPEQGVYQLESNFPLSYALGALVLGGAVAGAVRWKLKGERERALTPASEPDFVRGELLGEGATSEVFAASSRLAPGKPLAVKILKPSAMGDESTKQRLLRSVKSNRGLRHPNLVKFYKAGQIEDGRPFLLLERLRGSTLEKYLARNPKPNTEDILSIVRPLCSVLAYLHKQGVVHRDVKPDNIFLTSEGGLKLMDLEISRSQESEDLTKTGIAIGTPFYMAPEQARGELRPESDQYALGVLVFEMLTGQKPFQSKSPLELIQQHLSQSPPSARSLEPRITVLQEAVINKMLAKNPTNRFSDLDECLKALEEALAGAPADDQTSTQM